MKKIIVLIVLISFCANTNAQNDTGSTQKYVLRNPVVTLDMNGNAYYFEKIFDHIPTHEDSVAFFNEEHSSMKEIMDSVERENKSYSRYIDSVNKIYTSRLKNYAPLTPREGKHLFSLHWISMSKFGAVVIKKINHGKYSIKGDQRDERGNFVTILGYLKTIKKGEMKFYGEIQSKVSFNNNGEVCKKKGEFTFLCSPGRKYWRLQERENCGGEVVDYVDIFF